MSSRQLDEERIFQKSVVRANKEDVRAWALLFCAYRYAGDLDGYSEAEARMNDLARRQKHDAFDAFDKLFIGFAQSETHVLIPDGVAKLRDVVREQPSWVIAHAMLANALAHLADDTRESRYLEEAMRESLLARGLQPDNPFVMAVALHVHATAIVSYGEESRDNDLLRDAAEQLAGELESTHPRYVFGRITRARYFSAIDKPEKALKEWKIARDIGGGGMVTSYIVCLQVRLGEKAAALPDAEETPWRYAMLGDGQATIGACDELELDSTLATVWANYLRRLCGQRELASSEWDKLADSSVAKPRWLNNPLRLFREEVTPEELLQEYSVGEESRFWAAHTHFCVAAEYLARGEVREAEAYFEKCIHENAWSVDLHHAAIGLLERLQQNDEWPANLVAAPE